MTEIQSKKKQPEIFLKNKFKTNVHEMITVFILAMVIRTFLICPFKIPSSSMEPTLHGDERYGDKIFVNRYIYYFEEPKRGDIIVFKTRNIPGLDGKKDFIKRLVGLPGETVCIKDEKLYINGLPVETPEIFKERKYVYDRFSTMTYGDPDQPVKIPEDCYFVMGDNTWNSKDSRYFGFVPKQNVLGKAMCIWWPLKRSGILR